MATYSDHEQRKLDQQSGAAMDRVRRLSNARLIASAPELLEALKLAEGHLEEMRLDRKWHPIEHCPVLDRVRQVIAKAEGR